MTLDEVFTHLDLLHTLSYKEHVKLELTSFLPCLLSLFKQMLVEYDNSEMNIIITNIINNVVAAKNITKQIEPEVPKIMIVANTATEVIDNLYIIYIK